MEYLLRWNVASLPVVIELCVETTVEDASWLRKETSDIHINMAELDAVIRGMNMALMWKLKKVTVFTDSVTVFHWVSDALPEKSRLRSKAMGEMLN